MTRPNVHPCCTVGVGKGVGMGKNVFSMATFTWHNEVSSFLTFLFKIILPGHHQIPKILKDLKIKCQNEGIPRLTILYLEQTRCSRGFLK